MKVLGWTLIVAAILMHFCFCDWCDPTSSIYADRQIVAWFYAKEMFRYVTEVSRYGSPSYGYNTAGAGFWGLVIPALVAGSGFALQMWRPRQPSGNRSGLHETQRAAPPQPPLIVIPSPQVIANPNLLPCPDCGRQVSRRAASCPSCGCPISVPVAENDTVFACSQCQQRFSVPASALGKKVSCPHCGAQVMAARPPRQH